MSLEDRAQPILEHLDELWGRTRRIALWIFVGAMVGYFFAPQAMEVMQRPVVAALQSQAGKIIYVAPFEKLWVYLRVSLIVGILGVSPMILWEILQFLRPALNLKERSRLGLFCGVFAFCFLAGAGCGFRWVLPLVMQAILHFGGGAEVPYLSLSSTINVVLGILLFSALLAELPILMIFSSLWGWVEPATWGRGRRLSLVVNAVVSAVLSPPDALSMLLMMGPIQILYECGIWGAYVAKWLVHETHHSDPVPSGTDSSRMS
jgi:sec-independent protein translocase protein TatC